MDWDVPFTEFSDIVTHVGVVSSLIGSGGSSNTRAITDLPLLILWLPIRYRASRAR